MLEPVEHPATRAPSASSTDNLPTHHIPGGTMTFETTPPPMPDHAPTTTKRRRRPLLIGLIGLTVAVATAAVVVWMNATPYSETVIACKKALTAQMKAGGEGKPSACKDVKQDDYDALVIANVFDGMSKKDRDMLDYYDNGTIDGSIG